MQSIPFIQWCIDHLNYWTITLLMTIESSFIPFPSEIVIPPAPYFGELNLLLIIVFGTIGADLGAIFNYYFALWIGRPIVYKFADSRIGHLCLLDASKIANAEAFFKSLQAQKPASLKGTYVKSVYLTTTMGPSVQIENLYN